MVASFVLQAGFRRAAALLSALLACAVLSSAAQATTAKGRLVTAPVAAGLEVSKAAPRPRAAAVAPSCANADLSPAPGNLDEISDATLCLLNAQRIQRDRRPLAANRKLATAARGHVRDMLERSYFSHDGLDGSAFVDRIRATGYISGASDWLVGENLAWGTGVLATPREIMKAWMASPGHKANILERDYREIGIAVVPGNPVQTDGLGATYGTEFGFVTKPAKRAGKRRER
jgi:uncharacterized protein YkwD